MKIHEKDTNSTTAAAPPSPLKRRRLSSKRKLSHDAESEREDPGPAKKVLWVCCTVRSIVWFLAEISLAFIITVWKLGGDQSWALWPVFPWTVFCKVSGKAPICAFSLEAPCSAQIMMNSQSCSHAFYIFCVSEVEALSALETPFVLAFIPDALETVDAPKSLLIRCEDWEMGGETGWCVVEVLPE